MMTSGFIISAPSLRRPMHLSGFAGSHYGKIQTGLFGFYHNDFTTLPFLPLFQTPTEASELQDSGRPLSSST